MAKPGPKGPWEYDKEFHPRNFVELSQAGKNITQIARDWKINRKTIYQWEKDHPEFCNALELGRIYCEAWYTDIGQAAMLNQARSKDGKPIKVDFQFFKWMTQNVCKWSEHDKQLTNIVVNPQITSSPKEVEDKLTKLVDRIKSRKKEV